MNAINKIEEFKIGLALLNGLDASLPREKLIDSGDELFGRMVETSETFADFVKTHGQPRFSRTTPTGLEIHEWTGVQFRKGQPRGTLYLMEFDGQTNASMFN